MDENLKKYLDSKFEHVDQKFEGIDRKFADIDQKFERVNQKFEGINQKFEGINQKFEQVESRLVEKMRDTQTKLLRGFESFSAGQAIRLRKVEADQANLDLALRSRVDIVESRLLQIEFRRGIQ